MTTYLALGRITWRSLCNGRRRAQLSAREYLWRNKQYSRWLRNTQALEIWNLLSSSLKSHFPVLTHWNPIYVITPYWLRLTCKHFPLSYSRASDWSSLQAWKLQFCTYLSSPLCIIHNPHLIILLDLTTLMLLQQTHKWRLFVAIKLL